MSLNYPKLTSSPPSPKKKNLTPTDGQRRRADGDAPAVTAGDASSGGARVGCAGSGAPAGAVSASEDDMCAAHSLRWAARRHGRMGGAEEVVRGRRAWRRCLGGARPAAWIPFFSIFFRSGVKSLPNTFGWVSNSNRS